MGYLPPFQLGSSFAYWDQFIGSSGYQVLKQRPPRVTTPETIAGYFAYLRWPWYANMLNEVYSWVPLLTEALKEQ